jgi:hypothetical protein
MFLGGSNGIEDVSMRGPVADSVACTLIDLGGSKAMPDVSILGPMAVRVVPAVMVLGEDTAPLVDVGGCVLTWGWGTVCAGLLLMIAVPDGSRSPLWAFSEYRKTAARRIKKTGRQYFMKFFVIMEIKNPLLILSVAKRKFRCQG